MRTDHPNPNPVMDRNHLDPDQDFIQQQIGMGGGPRTAFQTERPTTTASKSSPSMITTITTTTTTTALLLLLLLFNSIYTKVLNLIPLYKIRTGKSFFITFSFERTPFLFLLVSHLYLLLKSAMRGLRKRILMLCDEITADNFEFFWIFAFPTKLNSRLLLVLIQCVAASINMKKKNDIA